MAGAAFRAQRCCAASRSRSPDAFRAKLPRMLRIFMGAGRICLGRRHAVALVSMIFMKPMQSTKSGIVAGAVRRPNYIGGEWATDPCSCFGVQEQVRPPTRPRPLWSADAGTVTISFGEAVRRKTSVIMLFVKLPARQTADLTGRPLQQQNERRSTKRKGQSEVEIVSVCRKDAPHAHLANEILVMQWKPAARWACSIPLGVISEPL